jgi:RNA polymerase sigma factor (sigma-70 family)
MEETSDIELIKHYCKGEAKAFDKLYDRYDRLVLHISKKTLGNSMFTEDIKQEVFVKVLENIFEYYQSHPDMNFKAWIITITRHTCYNWSKRESRGKEIVKEELGNKDIENCQVSNPEKTALQNESGAVLLEIIEQLNDSEKTIVKNFSHDIPVKETADMLGISQRHVHRLFGQTKDVMEKELRKRGL